MINTDKACLTIVSKNYLPSARVLCSSFLKHHQGARFYVLLVDEMGEEFDEDKEEFELLHLDQIGLPGDGVFPYQYTILELNTAVKPFALKYLLNQDGIEKVTYIDPDILIMSELDAVWNALNQNSIVMTPHMREPFSDGAHPTELCILKSGSYNLGFIGLKNCLSSIKLLNWWIGKLYLDCVVDIPKGLFVDQKWMDLVPSYFDDTYILHDPTYNVAYWNLHERDIEYHTGAFTTEGAPVSFFHFSGYDPMKPNILSKHQNRHNLIEESPLKMLFDEYGTLLLKAGYAKAKEDKYTFSTLPNGINFPRALHNIIRHCLRNNLPFPSPAYDSDAFCRWAMTPNIMLFGFEVAPLIHGILLLRDDVNKYYTGAFKGENPAFFTWLKGTGREEEQLGDILEEYSELLHKENCVKYIYNIYNSRKDLQLHTPEIGTNYGAFKKFINWLELHGNNEESLESEWIDRVRDSKAGLIKCTSLYFMRPDLQNAFPILHKDHIHYFNWLKMNAPSLRQINQDEIYAFGGLAKHSEAWFSELQNQLSRLGESGKFNSSNSAPLRNLEVYYNNNDALQEDYPDAFNDVSELRRLFKSQNRLFTRKSIFGSRSRAVLCAKAVESYEPDKRGINLLGYIYASTGMGQSCKSMLTTIKAANLNYSVTSLPNLYNDNDACNRGLGLDSYRANAKTENRINLFVSNADSAIDSIDFMGKDGLKGRRNIGYWVWETEELPKDYANSADELDEVWTASEYSARAIRKCINKKVSVLPHIIDFNEIDKIQSNPLNKSHFGLPTDAILYGYFFDQKSNLERKNPEAVIEAFKSATEDEKLNIALVIKVNTPLGGELEYEMLKANYADLNIIWIEETLSRSETLELMNCLDVYISLHRAEGFGLTLAEAMALGKAVIATNYSGNVDFMNKKNSYLVDCEVISTKRKYGPYPRGTRWANPCIESATKAILKSFSSSERESVGKKAYADIRSQLSPDVIAQKLLSLLK